MSETKTMTKHSLVLVKFPLARGLFVSYGVSHPESINTLKLRYNHRVTAGY